MRGVYKCLGLKTLIRGTSAEENNILALVTPYRAGILSFKL
jgi:hypothetical protein